MRIQLKVVRSRGMKIQINFQLRTKATLFN